MIDPDVAQALEDVARQLGEAREVDEILDTVVEAARLAINEVDHAGISVTHRDGRIETRAATGDLVRQLDLAQYELGQGPCLDAMDDHVDREVVVVEDARHEQRWPDYIQRAVQLGLRSQLGVRVYVEHRTVGGLNLYSTSSDTISPESAALAHLFAAHAAVALGRIRREHQLLEALQTRELIGQATGVVMERYGLTPERSFDYLVRVSQSSNTRMRELATQVVREAHASGPAITSHLPDPAPGV